MLTRQVLDAESPYCGGFMDGDRLVGSQSISAVASLGYAYLLPESRHYRSEELLQRILLAAEFARRHRNPSGCFDLLTTNFDSAPDTGFVVQAIAPVVFAAREQAADDGGAAEIADALGELIQTAAPGMVAGGFHTPNHRWVLVAALAQAQALYPELEVSATVDAYLGEGIDINADGEYSERSTGVYNAVVNRALIRAANVLERPDLLEPVRRNLDLSYHLLHADATAVTSISKRQDRDTRAVPTGLADGYHALAHLDGNGFYAAVADLLVERGGSGLICLPNYVLHPEWRATCIERTPLPERYSRVYPASGLWRVRQGAVSATAAAGLTAPFSVVCGQAELAAVKISSTYFATGQFIGEEFAAAGKGVRMQHKGRNLIYPEKDYVGGIYWLPIAEQVNADNWQEVRGGGRRMSCRRWKSNCTPRRYPVVLTSTSAPRGAPMGCPFRLKGFSPRVAPWRWTARSSRAALGTRSFSKRATRSTGWATTPSALAQGRWSTPCGGCAIARSTRSVCGCSSPCGRRWRGPWKSAVGSGRTRRVDFYRLPPAHRTPCAIICCMPRRANVPGPCPNAV